MTCQITAKVLAHSVGEDAPPLVTFQLRYPRIIHAESKTHRLLSEGEIELETPGLMNDPSLSRNARSSRAVPVPRLIEEVMTSPFIPRYWGAHQKGMQAGAEHDAPVELYAPRSDRGHPLDNGWRLLSREEAWLEARDRAAEAAHGFHQAGYAKQICNRLIEPFMHIDTVVTGTEWSNFFALRDHDMAEPHIRDLARAMKAALAESEPTRLYEDYWHTPYVSDANQADVKAIFDYGISHNYALTYVTTAVSAVRCARISYTPFHGESGDIASEMARYEQLVSARPMHASPLEHQARPDRKVNGLWEQPHLHGNLRGWIQLRKTIPGETA